VLNDGGKSINNVDALYSSFKAHSLIGWKNIMSLMIKILLVMMVVIIIIIIVRYIICYMHLIIFQMYN